MAMPWQANQRSRTRQSGPRAYRRFLTAERALGLFKIPWHRNEVFSVQTKYPSGYGEQEIE